MYCRSIFPCCSKYLSQIWELLWETFQAKANIFDQNGVLWSSISGWNHQLYRWASKLMKPTFFAGAQNWWFFWRWNSLIFSSLIFTLYLGFNQVSLIEQMIKKSPVCWFCSKNAFAFKRYFSKLVPSIFCFQKIFLKTGPKYLLRWGKESNTFPGSDWAGDGSLQYRPNIHIRNKNQVQIHIQVQV